VKTMSERLRVLIVESSPSEAELMVRELQRANLEPEIERVETEPAFVGALADGVPDLVLCGLGLPAFGGLRALALTREHAPGVPVIIVTCSMGEEMAVECMKAGAADYVLKDQIRRLGAAARGALERRQEEYARRMTERGLAESERRFRTWVELTPAAIFQINAQGRYIFANPAACRLAGRSASELNGMSIHDPTSPLGQWEGEGVFEALLRDGQVNAEMTLRSQDGTDVEVILDGVRLQEDRFLAFCTDITARRRAEAAWRAAEARYRTFLDSTSDQVFLKDSRLRYLFCNRVGLDYLRRSEQEVLGRTDAGLMPSDQAAACQRSDHAALAASRPVLGEETAGDRSFEVVKFPVPLAGGEVGVGAFIRDVTAKKAAERAQVESERRYRALFEGAYDGILLLRDSRIIDANPAAEELYGASRAALLGRHPGELSPAQQPDGAESLAHADQAMTEALAGRVQRFEWLHVRTDGSEFLAEVSLSPLQVGDETLVQAILRDITARKRAEEEIRRREQVLERIFSIVPVGLWFADAEGKLQRGNPAGIRIWGGEPQVGIDGYGVFKVRRLPGREEVWPEDWALTRTVRDGVTVVDELLEIDALDGEHRIILNSTAPLLDEHGRVEGAVIVNQEVTDRIKAEDALRASEERYRSLFEGVPIGVYQTTPDGRILVANEALVRMLGFSSFDELASRHLESEAYQPGYPRAVFRTRIEKEGSVVGLESVWRRADGSPIHVREWAKLVRAPDGSVQCYEGTVEDITHQTRLREQLLHAQKMEAVGRLAGGVAHDFNNLLQAMLSLSEVLRRRSQDPARVGAIVDELGQHIKRGTALTRQLLLFSRQETVRPERLDLTELVEGSSRLLGRLLRENIAFAVNAEPQPLRLTADRGQIEQVLMNLVVNAADAMPGGGSLVIRCGAVPPDAVFIEVEDTGAGMSPEILEHIFEPFFTTKAAGKGTGLGLAVVHGIVTQHGGRIEVHSQEGVGTRFRILLPAEFSGEQPRVDIAEVEPAALATGKGERVLVVEDEPAARQGLLELLEVLGYEAVAVGSGGEAGHAAASSTFDLLLTDLMLPDVSGADLAVTLSERWPEMKVILMSGYAEDEYVRLRAFTGVVRFLQKPFDVETLARELRAALGGEGG